MLPKLVLSIFLRKHSADCNLQVLRISVTTAEDAFNKAMLGLHEDQVDFNDRKNPFSAISRGLNFKYSKNS